MTAIVCVHGIGQQVKGEDELLSLWVPALRSGVRLAGGDAAAEKIVDREVRCAFYGDLFRVPGRYLSGTEAPIDPDDLDDFEQDLLFLWWQRAADTDPRVVGPGERTLGRTPRSVKAALRALSNARYLGGLTERMLLTGLRQVRLYVGGRPSKPERGNGLGKRAGRLCADAGSCPAEIFRAHGQASMIRYLALGRTVLTNTP
jgi:hypothetical protein